MKKDNLQLINSNEGQYYTFEIVYESKEDYLKHKPPVDVWLKFPSNCDIDEIHLSKVLPNIRSIYGMLDLKEDYYPLHYTPKVDICCLGFVNNYYIKEDDE